MEINYMLYDEEVKSNKSLIEKGEPVEIEIMDQRDKIWQRGRVLVLESPAEGAHPAALLGPQGEPYGAGKFYVKVVEMLPSDEDD